ncbi:MAG: dihydroxyacetone kinase phosphoprotein-dependent L subunit [Sulfitobacter sp.]|jgi:dihydroxyacetone kinase phosphoprotein-dependent L subunit
MTHMKNAGAGKIIEDIAAVIVANKAYLSKIDGLIGDGDHGVNMAKGFSRAADRIAGREVSLSEAMSILSDVLMSEIGGSMGPLYGVMFAEMAEAIEATPDIDAETFAAMLRAGQDGIFTIGSAKVGDKTLMDVLIPATASFAQAIAEGVAFRAALPRMTAAAEAGRDSTINLVAQIGRSARLGERSRGVLDAGAASCCMILTGLANGVDERLDG